MQSASFTWADLSCYDTKPSLDFYRCVFGWEYENQEEYNLAIVDEHYVAGIYETPAFFKKINMPHFWMSYFKVECVEKSVELAESLGAKVEIASADFNRGKIALIRDEQGAGFTIYEGDALGLPSRPIASSIRCTELQVSKVDKVIPFYSKLFGWTITQSSQGSYVAYNTAGGQVAQINQIPNELKSKYEYWVTTIVVQNLKATQQKIIANGGSIISEESKRVLVADNSGEAFFYIQR